MVCCNDVFDLHAAEVLWQSSIHGFQERLKSKQLDLPRAVRDSIFQFRKQAFPNCRLAHELTHLLISIQEGPDTRDPHEERDQWKFQENNRHTQRYKHVNRAQTRWKACEANMIQRLPLRERRGVKKALNPEYLGERKGRSKCHRDEPVENDDWFTQSNHIVLYAAKQEYPSPDCQRLCVILGLLCNIFRVASL